MLHDRSTWIHALTALPAEDIKSLVDCLSEDYTVKFKALPQSGLGMLKFKDTAFHEPYFMGEFPVSSAWVALTVADGRVAEGAAQVIDDDADLASALAVADAILANQMPGWEQLEEKLHVGVQLREDQNRLRKAMLTKTAVDFFLLSAAEEETND